MALINYNRLILKTIECNLNTKQAWFAKERALF